MARSSNIVPLLCMRFGSRTPLAVRAARSLAVPTRIDVRTHVSGSGDGDQERAAKMPVAAPFRGKYTIEGQVLPIADTSSNVGVDSIEARLGRRMSANRASESLEASMDTARMFVAQPTDRVTDVNACHQPIEAHLDHTENFQKVFRRLRRTGRNDDQREASDSLKKVMEYLEKKKASR
uniref:Uncharacterized protein n=1 Tax=Noctiluca scintillans TaxID=2966 RepID=A0A7S1AXI9_NOCSC|mmetsp:Transcript_64085/g.169841  ORF Transcript_64085/g.169841 Transcript_64085/m.169841 type:complete len:179 (+) Transcript_64085:58-594(+)